ncbi:MAG: sigma-70 family RNA polymerase sigma factor [Gemmatimonadetes bacterium]|nr:sigma-70 family RNA polymerase sigma factor [Gemmatimonadota bacterium]
MATPETRTDTGGIEDARVVEAVLAGRSELYRILVRRYQDVMYRHALRMVGDGDEAADLVQKAFVKGFRKLDACHDPAKVGGWLFRICANMCKDYLKSRRRQDLSLDVVDVQLDLAPGPIEELERADMRRTIETAIGELTPGLREAFVMKHLEGCSYEKMAELMDVSISALKMRVHRAREELQEKLAGLVPAEWSET